MDLSHLGGIDMSQRVYVKPLPNCFLLEDQRFAFDVGHQNAIF